MEVINSYKKEDGQCVIVTKSKGIIHHFFRHAFSSWRRKTGNFDTYEERAEVVQELDESYNKSNCKNADAKATMSKEIDDLKKIKSLYLEALVKIEKLEAQIYHLEEAAEDGGMNG